MLHDLDHHGDRDVVAGLVDLAVNVRADAPPPWLRSAIEHVDLAAYPDQREALAAVAARHRRAPSEVLLTAGGAEAFVLVARALRPRRAVIVHPQFTEPEAALRAAGHEVERVVLAPPFVLDPAEVPLDADLVVLGNPTNPTSVRHPAATIDALVRPGRLVVVDEAFADTVPGEPESMAARPDLTGLVVIRSLTKTWGIAGLRAGYVLAASGIVDRLRSAQPAWPVSSPALAATAACSSPDAVAQAADYADRLAGRRRDLVRRLASVPGVTVAGDPTSSFVLLETPDDDIRAKLLETGFAVRRGETFPGLASNWIRVAVRDETTGAAFCDALTRVLS